MSDLSFLPGILVPRGPFVGTHGVSDVFPIGTVLNQVFSPAHNGATVDEVVPYRAIGLAANAGVSGPNHAVQVVSSGLFTMTPAQWDEVIADGTTGGLIPDADYFLSTPGKISIGLPQPTNTGPVGYQTRIGTSTSRTSLIINLQQLEVGDAVSTLVEGFGITAFSLCVPRLPPRVPHGGEGWLAGMPVYVKSSDGKLYKAVATSFDSSSVLGLMSGASTASPLPSQSPIMAGLVTLTQPQWDAITDAFTGGLSPGSYYYLSDVTPGNITVTPPSGEGHFVFKIGLAISNLSLAIQLGTPTPT